MHDVLKKLKLRHLQAENTLREQLCDVNFQGLTEWAAHYIEEHMKVRYSKNSTVLERVWMRSIFDDDVIKFIYLTEKSRKMHIALRAAIEECMIQNFDFDPALEQWYENAKKQGPPASKGNRPVSSDLASHIFRSCIERMKHYTMFEPLRDEKDALHHSLCDIVAIVSNNSYSNIKTTWMTREKDVFPFDLD